MDFNEWWGTRSSLDYDEMCEAQAAWEYQQTIIDEQIAREAARWKSPATTDYDRSIHSNPDAKAWTEFFKATFPNCGADEETMHTWFANAMMAAVDVKLAELEKQEPVGEIINSDVVVGLLEPRVYGTEFGLKAGDKLYAQPVQPAEQEPICLDRGHRNWKKKTGEECTCRKYVPYTKPLPPAVPDGWQLVPKVLTTQMFASACISGFPGDVFQLAKIYEALLSAAPKEVE